MNSKKIREIFLRFRKANPHPTTELVYHSHFELLVAVIMSAQSTDKSVNKVTEVLFKAANTPQEIAALGAAGLEKYMRSINYFKTKAKNIAAMSRMLVEQFHSRVPNNREALESLPGVGRKTANVVLNTAFKEPLIAVDTHIFRVANRIGLTHGKTPLEVEKQLTKIVPKEFAHDTHHWLILHGRYVCVARRPKCPECLIRDLCKYPDKTQ